MNYTQRRLIQGEREALNREIEDLKRSGREIGDALDAVAVINKQLQEDNASLESELDRLDRSEQASWTECERLESELSVVGAEHEELEKENNRLAEALAQQTGENIDVWLRG